MRYFTSFLLVVCLSGCAGNSLNKINWDDPRCFTFNDVWNQRNSNSNNRGAIFAALLAGNLTRANTIATGGNAHWVPGYSGDSKMIWVGYTQDGQEFSYKDVNYVELSMADVKRLGPVITKYSNFAESNPIYQSKFQFALQNPKADKSFFAEPKPASCNLGD